MVAARRLGDALRGVTRPPMTMSRPLSRGLRRQKRGAFCESVCTDSLDSRSTTRARDRFGGDVRRFFLRHESAIPAASKRRRNDVAATADGFDRRLRSRRPTCKMRRFRKGFRDSLKIVAVIGAVLRACAMTARRRHVAFSSRACSEPACTRFVNAEAVFFVVL
jgi:hypothetical protein